MPPLQKKLNLTEKIQVFVRIHRASVLERRMPDKFRKEQIVAPPRLGFPDVRKGSVFLKKRNRTRICPAGQSGEAYAF